MGLFSFIKTAGSKVFGSKETQAPDSEKQTLKASVLMDHVKSLSLKYEILTITLRGDDVVLEGKVTNQSDSEKIVLAVGNVEGVDTVDNQMTVTEWKPMSKFHTVMEGDWLSKIAQKYYGDPNKYDVIFEANRFMLDHPDKIYPGQVLRIPEL